MSNIQLPAGTTVNLENVPLHQFYHLSLHPATPVVIVAVYTLVVHYLNRSRGQTLSRIEAKRQELQLDTTYHHAGAITTMWVGCYFGSPQLIFYVIENSIVHTLMYTYFALTAMGYSPPGKKYLTHIQIFQFLIGLVFIALYITIPGCLTPLQRNLLFVMLSYLIPLIYLFVDFSIKTYGKKSKSKVKTM
ncbi:hypothetical protein GGF43_005193 [Coemansia sp. RSA 2618]|nr:hypothetical protein GGF43_005193 [Coemansia sp. RSA 2618]